LSARPRTSSRSRAHPRSRSGASGRLSAKPRSGSHLLGSVVNGLASRIRPCPKARICRAGGWTATLTDARSNAARGLRLATAREDEGDADGEAVEEAEGDGEEELAQRGGRRHDRGDDERDHDEVAEELDEVLVRDDAGNRQEEDEHRQLRDEPEREQ